MHVKSSEEETAVPAVCCDNGFLNEEYQQEDDGRKKLVVTGKKSLSYEVKWLSLEATLYSTRFMPRLRLERGTGYESALLALEKRVLKSSQDVEMVPVDFYW